MNIQYAVKREEGRPNVYVLEVNPRASRTVPFVSKATGMPLAKAAAKVMVGVSLAEQGYTQAPDAAAVLGQGGRLPLRQVRRRRHRARAGNEIDRRSDGHQRAFSDRLRQEPIGRRHAAAPERQGLHQRHQSLEGARDAIGPAVGADGLRVCWPPRARPCDWRRRAFACSRSRSSRKGTPTCWTT